MTIDGWGGSPGQSFAANFVPMKYIIILLFLSFPAGAQQLKWEKNLKDAFLKARQQDKVLFVEFYSPGCPYCQRIAPFFKEKAVADLYNTAFINYQLNVETDEAREFTERMNLDVYGIPYFLFFRADSTLVHAREVSAELNSVLQPGKMVTEKTYTGENYARRFGAGERSENFLTHYALFSRVKKDTLTNRRIIDALWESYPVEKRNSRTSWIILKKALMDAQNGFADYWLANASQAAEYETGQAQANVESAFSRIFYGTLFGREAKSFSAAQWKALREKFTPVLGEKETQGLTWEKEMLAHLREGHTAEAVRVGEQAARYSVSDAAGLTYLARVLENNCNEKACREAVSAWRESARRLQEQRN